MSWYRKVKSMYSISFVTFSFIIWSTLSKLLFKNPLEYKLFLICLPIVFLTQYLSMAKLKRTFLIMVLLGLIILVSLTFFKGQAIFLNTIFLLFMTFITYSLENVPIDYSQYKEDVNKSLFALVFIWMIAFSFGIEFINDIYKFNILYIITIIILMRETRRYVYSIKSNTSMVTNIIIGISVLSISLDYANIIIAKLLEIIIATATFILSIILSFLNIIIGGPIAVIAEKIEFIITRKGSLNNQNTNNIGNSLIVEPDITKYKNNSLTPIFILIIKILILLLILYIIYKFLSRFRNKTKVYNGYVEEKEKIVKKKDKKYWAKGFLSKIFQGNKSNREKILYIYKGFEKITEASNIYKPYMTATQLENLIKLNVDNFDNLDEMTQIYNEAKFSVHPMTDEKVMAVKKGHSNIRKQL